MVLVAATGRRFEGKNSAYRWMTSCLDATRISERTMYSQVNDLRLNKKLGTKEVRKLNMSGRNHVREVRETYRKSCYRHTPFSSSAVMSYLCSISMI